MQNSASKPTVSVLMPAYNTASYIGDAIESILAQTFPDYELLICDDASTDNTLEIISSFNDRRIRVLKNKTNQGIPFSRNRLVEAAQGQYLAWLDADDTAYPDRLQKQVDFLEEHSGIYVLGTYAHWYSEKEKVAYEYKPPLFTSEEARAYLFFRNCLANSSVMMRRGIEYEYKEEFSLAQDYELWSRISRKYSIALLPDFLIKYRDHGSSASSQGKEKQKAGVKTLFKNQLEDYNLDVDQYLDSLYLLCSYEYQSLKGQERRQVVGDIFIFLKKMRLWNKKHKHFDIIAYNYVIGLFFQELIPFASYRQRLMLYLKYYPAARCKRYALAVYTFIEAISAFIHFTLLPKIKKKLLAEI